MLNNNNYKYIWLNQSLCKIVGSYNKKSFEVIYQSERKLYRVNGEFTDKEKENIIGLVI